MRLLDRNKRIAEQTLGTVNKRIAEQTHRTVNGHRQPRESRAEAPSPIYSEHLTSQTLQAPFFFELEHDSVSPRGAADSILSEAREPVPDGPRGVRDKVFKVFSRVC